MEVLGGNGRHGDAVRQSQEEVVGEEGEVEGSRSSEVLERVWGQEGREQE